MPFFSSSSTSVNEIVRGDAGGHYTRKDAGRKESSRREFSRKDAKAVTTHSTKKRDPARTQSLRRSITDYQVPPPFQSYHTSFPNASLSHLDESLPPPLYEDLDEVPLPKSRFKVTPRVEEGREILPSYKCSLLKEAMFDRKIEMESPFERAGDRKWGRVYCVLNNTVLNIHRVKRTAIIARADPLEEDPDDPTGYAPGPLIKSFTLQHAEVGAASDYKKRSYVIRIRAETQQFLLACKTVETFFNWLEGISSGINLALPLEERSLPKYQTIPRRRRRRRVQPVSTDAAAEEVVLQQQEIIRRHYPQLLIEDDIPDFAYVDVDAHLDLNDRPGTSNGLDNIEGSGSVTDIEDGIHGSGIATPNSQVDVVPTDSLEDLSNLRISEEQQNTEVNAANQTWFSSRPSTAAGSDHQNPFAMRGHLAGFAKQTNASLNEHETRKWKSGSHVSREQHIRFAKRCMSILNANAPRQTNFVIEKGIRYELVPTEYKMVPDSRVTLPNYRNQKAHVYARASLMDL